MSREDDIQRAIEQVNRVKPHFWKPPSEIPYPLRLDTVKYVEEQLGHTLPDSYLAIMMIQNGGMPRYWAYIEQGEQEKLEQMIGAIPFAVITLHIPPWDRLAS